MRTERLADCSYVDVKRVFHDDGTGPDAVHQFVFGDKFAGGLGQNFEYLEGASTNRHCRSKNPKFEPSKVNLAFARRVNRLMASREHNDVMTATRRAWRGRCANPRFQSLP
jgi:hypothetical protein